ncbi:MAG: hypothetical protein ACREIP_18000 [Alphaproteobacteria bacterium]
MIRPATLILLTAAIAACSGSDKDAAATDPARPAASTPAPAGPMASAPSASSFEYDAPPIAEVGNVCTFRQRKDPVMSGFRDRSGASWEGEVRVRDLATLDPKWFSPSDKRIATLVARPRVDTFRVRVDDNCYNAQTRTYYSCSKVLEADLSAIRGFARALTIQQARGLAIQLCEKKVAEVVDAKINIKQDNLDLRCRIVQQTFCELPAAPPPPPATAKKK